MDDRVGYIGLGKLAECGWSPDDWEAWFVRVVLDATHTHGAKV